MKINLLQVGLLGLGVVVFCGCEQKRTNDGKDQSAPKATNALLAAAPSQSSASDLVGRMASIDVTNGPVSAERVAEWQRSLADLAGQGVAAIPAIREFLAKNTDVNFESNGNDQALGASSLRLALLQCVEKIGGSNAVALAGQTFQTTADPTELAVLVRYLDRVEPEKHRAAAVSAARETLALATTPAWDGRDVSPLFEILKKFGGADAPAELERYANTWFDYTPITLAQLPNSAGVPSLIRLAKNADGRLTLGRDMYQRVLAQVAMENTNAADALVEQVHDNRIDVGAWPAVGMTLAGNTLHLAKPLLETQSPLAARPDTRKYHVSVGNQNYLEATPPEKMTAEDVGRRIRLVDRLLEATTNPAAIDALENARVSLAARLPPAK
jgi:hypothetical protein